MLQSTLKNLGRVIGIYYIIIPNFKEEDLLWVMLALKLYYPIPWADE
jgi:hypothetical protein